MLFVFWRRLHINIRMHGPAESSYFYEFLDLDFSLPVSLSYSNEPPPWLAVRPRPLGYNYVIWYRIDFLYGLIEPRQTLSRRSPLTCSSKMTTRQAMAIEEEKKRPTIWARHTFLQVHLCRVINGIRNTNRKTTWHVNSCLGLF